jgi:AraC family transcriptional regulator
MDMAYIEWHLDEPLSVERLSRVERLLFGDPDTTPADEFRFDICGEVSAPVPANPQGVENRTMAVDSEDNLHNLPIDPSYWS